MFNPDLSDGDLRDLWGLRVVSSDTDKDTNTDRPTHSHHRLGIETLHINAG